MSSEDSLVEPREANNQGSMDSPQPSATEYAASPSGSTTSAPPAGQSTFPSHTRAMSLAADTSNSLKSNRFSLQFPVSSGRMSLSDARDALPYSPENTPIPAASVDGNFLTAIAAHERKVLELKEELQKAEAELDKLKQHWAQHEARKKREDVRRVTQLQPLQTSFPAEPREDDLEGSSTWMQQEMERRKALMSGTRSSNRTVFSGSRHTRALSLLSPRDSVHPTMQRHQPPPRRDSLRKPENVVVGHMEQDIPARLTRPATAVASFAALRDSPSPDNAVTNKSLDHEALLRQGKKMATDFKDGLWTFWEDLRQATVGEEATSAHPPKRQTSSQTLRTARKQSSRNSLRPSSRGSSVSKASTETKRPSPVRKTKPAALPDLADPSFWSEHGTMGQATVSARNHSAASSLAERSPPNRYSLSSNEAWDTWDESPAQSRTSSVISEPTTIPSTVSGSPRTSTSTNRDMNEVSRKGPIPWPAITKAGSATLRRTASHLMQEWENLERSLTPNPGEEFTGQEYFLGASSEAAFAGAGKPRAGKSD